MALKRLFGGGSGSGVSNPTVSTDKTTTSGTGVKPNSTVTVYKNGTSAGTATANGSGAWSYTFGSALSPGDVVTYDATVTSSSTTVATTAPAAPSLTVSAGNAQATIAWMDGSNGGAAITSHKLYRGTSAGGETLVGTISTASPYTDTGLTNGTTYYYKLSAVNARGEGALSAEASATPTAVPTMPTGAAGIWYSDQYNSGSTTIPNAIAGGPVMNFYSAPTYSNGVLDMSNGSVGNTTFSPALSVSEFTALAVVSKITNGNGLETLLATDGDQNALACPLWYSNPPTIKFGGNASPEYGQVIDSNTYSVLNDGFKVVGYRASATSASLWLNDAEIYGQTPNGLTLPVSLSKLNYMGAYDHGYFSGHKTVALAIYPRSLSDAEMRQAYAALAYRAQQSSVTITQDARVLLAEGDSITAANNGDAPGGGYIRVFRSNATGRIRGSIKAVNGNKLSDVVARAPYVDAIPSSHPGRTFVLSCLIGANDLTNYPGATDAAAAANYTADLFAYYDARRSAGYKVVACTILPTSNATHNARRAIVNANIRAAVGVHCDAVADFAGDAQMGSDNAYTAYPANWFDAVHPNDAGHVRMEAIYRPVVNALWP
jgi:lysophospholipase L1-like esterase